MDVLIVGRTKMKGSLRCIGGLISNGKSIRLLNAEGHNWDDSAAFQVGDIWDLDFHQVPNLVPPHVEDVIVTRAVFKAPLANFGAEIEKKIAPWRGGISSIFEGKLGFTSKGNGYVSTRLGVPSRSTWFWVPDRNLVLRDDKKHYDYQTLFFNRGLSYVGEQHLPEKIAAGTLTRVSLARWWKPEDVDDLEERCYLQLSGWY